MTAQSKEDYQFYATLRTNKVEVQRVPCKIYLPKRFSDSLSFHFRPNEEQYKKIEHFILPRFSVSGEIKGVNGEIMMTFSAEVVWSTNGGLQQYWGDEFMEASVYGEPQSLEIIHYLSPRKSENKTHGRFWLTPNTLLSPDTMLSQSYTGEVSVKVVRQLDFTLTNGINLAFKRRYLYKDVGDEEFLTFTDLVCEFEIENEETTSSQINDLRDELDDFLLLSSFASRERCICHGWDSINSKGSIDFYRRDVVFPKKREKKGER